MTEYYCDKSSCLFLHDGWCSYWDSSTQLMKIRGVKCRFDNGVYIKITEIMEYVIE